jgi:uncharacterized membrane protein YdfJ with MMPL/SSD domain
VTIGAFTTSRLVFLKELWLGVAAAVLIGAFVVRARLVPALMALLGRDNCGRPGRWPGCIAGWGLARPRSASTASRELDVVAP